MLFLAASPLPERLTLGGAGRVLFAGRIRRESSTRSVAAMDAEGDIDVDADLHDKADAAGVNVIPPTPTDMSPRERAAPACPRAVA